MTDRTVDKEPGAFRTITEVAEELDVPQHVLRFWESRFNQIRPLKRGGGRRFYRPEDVLLIRGIRHLLYGEGYTIKGVQRILKEAGVRHVQQIGAGGPPAEEAPAGPQVAWREEAGDPQDFPSIARPQAYAVPHGDVLSSAPVAQWAETGPDARSGGVAGEQAAQGEAAWSESQDPDEIAEDWSTPQRSVPDEPWGEQPGAPAYAEEATAASGSAAWSGHAPGRSGRLVPAHRRQLQEALAELLECRRLLAQSRSDGAGGA